MPPGREATRLARSHMDRLVEGADSGRILPHGIGAPRLVVHHLDLTPGTLDCGVALLAPRWRRGRRGRRGRGRTLRGEIRPSSAVVLVHGCSVANLPILSEGAKLRRRYDRRRSGRVEGVVDERILRVLLGVQIYESDENERVLRTGRRRLQFHLTRNFRICIELWWWVVRGDDYRDWTRRKPPRKRFCRVCGCSRCAFQHSTAR